MHILVLCGGDSDEREVSLRSGAAAASALRQAGYAVTEADPLDDFTDLLTDIDVVFPVLHGKGGEDGTIQKVLEEKNVPFVGSDSTASALCFDKHLYKQFLTQHTIDCAQSDLVSWQQFTDHPLAQKPYVLKPFDGGSSIDTFIVPDVTAVPLDEIQKAFTRHDRMLLEEYVEGIETTVTILGDRALPVVEIIPPAGKVFDYENKYNGATAELCPPQNIDETTQQKLQNLALQIHKLTGCKHLSRTDIIVTPEGRLVPLETNTIPGMTDQSLVPRAAQVAGIPMPELCKRLVGLATTN